MFGLPADHIGGLAWLSGAIPRLDDFDNGASLIGKREALLATPMGVATAADENVGLRAGVNFYNGCPVPPEQCSCDN
jgi:hypothetical protein